MVLEIYSAKSNEFYLSILNANWWQHMREMSVLNLFKYTIDKILFFSWIFVPYPAVQLKAKPSSTRVPALQAMSWGGLL